jgi:phospho-N-acetylmuramoyl-pentapeptide-transferase
MFFEWLSVLTGDPLFEGRLLRTGIAAMLAILLVFVCMPPYMKLVRNATSDFKAHSPPIMGGLLLVLVVLVTSLLTAQLNGYTIATLAILVSFSGVGAIDDFAKVRNKRLVNSGKLDKENFQEKADGISSDVRLALYFFFSLLVAVFCYKFIPELRGNLTVPFVNPEVWHPYLPNWAFIPFIAFVIAASANGTNFTDGLDSLASVPILTCMVFVGLVA